MSQEVKNKNSDGYTLVEIMLSILFFSAITLSVGYTFTSSINLTSTDQSLISANNLAKKFFREVEANWEVQGDYDIGALPTVTSTYTKNGQYKVTTSASTIATNSDSDVIVRRVKVVYKNKKNKTLVNLSLDYSRPGSQVTE